MALPTVASDFATVLETLDPGACTELLVVSNAGTLQPIGPVWSKPSTETSANLNTNLVSAIAFIGEVMRHFRSCDARKVIVNVSSGAARKGYAGWSLYCAAKAGMENFIRAIAAEEQVQAHPFTAISVDPGVMDTEMQAYIRSSTAEDFPDVERFRKRKDTRGLVPPEMVASAIIDLVSGQSLAAGECHDLPTSV